MFKIVYAFIAIHHRGKRGAAKFHPPLIKFLAVLLILHHITLEVVVAVRNIMVVYKSSQGLLLRHHKRSGSTQKTICNRFQIGLLMD